MISDHQQGGWTDCPGLSWQDSTLSLGSDGEGLRCGTIKHTQELLVCHECFLQADVAVIARPGVLVMRSKVGDRGLLAWHGVSSA